MDRVVDDPSPAPDQQLMGFGRILMAGQGVSAVGRQIGVLGRCLLDEHQQASTDDPHVDRVDARWVALTNRRQPPFSGAGTG